MLKALVLVLFSVLNVSGQQSLASQPPELVSFANDELIPMIQTLMDAKLPYPEINQRVKKQEALITARFKGRKLDVRLRWSRHTLSPKVNADSGISREGNPLINIYIPALFENYEGNRAYLIRVLMHERDHLTEVTKNEKEVSVENEIHIHALTTEYVTVPLKEIYKLPLTYNDQRHYDAWIKAGRSEKSPVWRDYIRRLLAPVTAK